MTATKPGFSCSRGRSAGACSGDGAQLVFLLPSEEATKDLAAVFCASRQPGDSYLIHGTLGAGKSAFWYAVGCRLSALQVMPGTIGRCFTNPVRVPVLYRVYTQSRLHSIRIW